MKPIPTLYEWGGGEKAYETLIDRFYDKVMQDNLLMPVFKNMSDQHRAHVAHFIIEVFSGPKLYTSTDGGSHFHMIGKHLGKMLDEEKRQRWMALLLETANEVNLPTDPEFRSALVGYLEWGTRLAVLNSQTTVSPIEHDEPMPVWGWGVPGGPYHP